MQRINGGQKEIFAGWFSGRIIIPHGKLLKYVHMGYESIYEKELYTDFENGILIDTLTADNLVFDDD